MIADRVKETTSTTGTGTINLGGPSTGFISFVSGIGSGRQCYYAIVGSSEWEVGIGTVTDAVTDTLSRDNILASSNSNSAVNFSAGTKDVFVTISANDIIIANSSLAPTKNIIIPSGNGSIVPDQLEILDGNTLEISIGSVLEIT